MHHSDLTLFECIIRAKEQECYTRGLMMLYIVEFQRVDAEFEELLVAMRNHKSRTTEFILEPIIGLFFDSRAEAYNLYSWEVVFGIRFGSSSRNCGNKYRNMQELVCVRCRSS